MQECQDWCICRDGFDDGNVIQKTHDARILKEKLLYITSNNDIH